ncbi:hypothetical protein NEOLEDRAFT_873360 [Neolentinus lepideus HHB14362 ss-1]|uniref:Uncharacterized protein n=1 Tax=Neolentinus lepideus HHB14362 ss-1 TaxID=1314782 RepID=A0A165P0R0_9AGAM|nr:hypothetical protein NEOLEDRAFT_873360 [Neolentinus lepideus HHB14362 ss-1]
MDVDCGHDEQLRHRVERLKSTFQYISNTITHVGQQSLVFSMLHSGENAMEIDRCQEILQELMAIFDIEQVVHLEAGQHQYEVARKADHGELMRHVRVLEGYNERVMGQLSSQAEEISGIYGVVQSLNSEVHAIINHKYASMDVSSSGSICAASSLSCGDPKFYVCASPAGPRNSLAVMSPADPSAPDPEKNSSIASVARLSGSSFIWHRRSGASDYATLDDLSRRSSLLSFSPSSNSARQTLKGDADASRNTPTSVGCESSSITLASIQAVASSMSVRSIATVDTNLSKASMESVCSSLVFLRP